MNCKERKRLSRLIRIIDKSTSLRCIKPAGLAEDLGVSKRTVYRDIKVLEEAGIPLVFDDTVGLQIKEGYRFPISCLNSDEVEALYLSRVLVTLYTQEKIVRHFEQAVDKIKQLLPDTLRNDIESVLEKDITAP